MKVVLDTNVLLSAFTKPGGRTVALWVAALLGLKSYDGIPIVRPIDFMRILGLV